MILNVNISEVRSAATKLQQSLAEFGSATNATKAAADYLCDSWEGDARDAFAAEQERVVQWFHEMEQIVETYINALNTAANVYEALNIDTTNAI